MKDYKRRNIKVNMMIKRKTKWVNEIIKRLWTYLVIIDNYGNSTMIIFSLAGMIFILANITMDPIFTFITTLLGILIMVRIIVEYVKNHFGAGVLYERQNDILRIRRRLRKLEKEVFKNENK